MYSTTATVPIRAASAATRVAVVSSAFRTAGRASFVACRHNGKRMFSSTPRAALKEFFPKVETKQIVDVESGWPHPVYVRLRRRSSD